MLKNPSKERRGKDRYLADEDRAIVYCTAYSQKEAIRDKIEDFTDAIIVVCELWSDQIINCEIDYKAMNKADKDWII